MGRWWCFIGLMAILGGTPGLYAQSAPPIDAVGKVVSARIGEYTPRIDGKLPLDFTGTFVFTTYDCPKATDQSSEQKGQKRCSGSGFALEAADSPDLFRGRAIAVSALDKRLEENNIKSATATGTRSVEARSFELRAELSKGGLLGLVDDYDIDGGKYTNVVKIAANSPDLKASFREIHEAFDYRVTANFGYGHQKLAGPNRIRATQRGIGLRFDACGYTPTEGQYGVFFDRTACKREETKERIWSGGLSFTSNNRIDAESWWAASLGFSPRSSSSALVMSIEKHRTFTFSYSFTWIPGGVSLPKPTP